MVALQSLPAGTAPHPLATGVTGGVGTAEISVDAAGVDGAACAGGVVCKGGTCVASGNHVSLESLNAAAANQSPPRNPYMLNLEHISAESLATSAIPASATMPTGDLDRACGALGDAAAVRIASVPGVAAGAAGPDAPSTVGGMYMTAASGGVAVAECDPLRNPYLGFVSLDGLACGGFAPPLPPDSHLALLQSPPLTAREHDPDAAAAASALGSVPSTPVVPTTPLEVPASPYLNPEEQPASSHPEIHPDENYHDEEPPDEFADILAHDILFGDVPGEETRETLLEVFHMTDTIESGVAELSKGVTREQAEKLWLVYDADATGFLALDEVRTLVADLGNAALKQLSNRMAHLMLSMADPQASAVLFKRLDIAGDGRVWKHEFMSCATRGIQNMPTHDVRPPPKRARSIAEHVTRSIAEAPPLRRTDSDSSTGSLTGLFYRSAAMIKSGLKDLSSGVAADVAEELWAEFDKDSSGYLDAEQVRTLFVEQAKVVCEQLQHHMDEISLSLADPVTAEHLLDEFDVLKDGVVHKEEFISLAMVGVHLPLKGAY